MCQETFKKLFPFTARVMGRPHGVALLMVLFFVTFMIFLATTVSYETIVEYNVASQNINRLKSYYAAKAGVEISLLRILIYKKAIATVGKHLKDKKQLLDSIWSFPLAWPPSAFLPEDISLVDRGLIKDAEKESTMDASYTTQITLEDSLIDINDLASPSKGLRQATRQQILNIFSRETESDEEFEERYSDFDFEELVNHITDWVDEDNDSLNGGNERNYYYDIKEIDFSSFNNDFYPPNRPFKTLEELHMVFMMEDELFDLIKGSVTIFGPKGINVNHASREVLLSIDPQMTEEVVDALIKTRGEGGGGGGGSFKSETEFIDFITSEAGSNIDPQTFNQNKVPLLFDTISNFRIISTGQFAKTIQEIVVITYDFDTTKEQLVTVLEKEDQRKKDEPDKDQTKSPSSTGSSGSKTSIPKGRPHIVYWSERV